MSSQKRIFYIALSANLLLIFAAALFFCLLLTSRNTPLTKELQIAHSAWLTTLDFAKSTTLKSKEALRSRPVKREEPPTLHTSPWIAGDILSVEDQRHTHFLKDHSLSLPEEVLSSPFKYFAQATPNRDLYFLSFLSPLQKQHSPLISLQMRFTNDPSHNSVFYTLAEHSLGSKSITLWSDFSKETSKKFLTLVAPESAKDLHPLFTQGPWNINLQGEKYTTLATELIHTQHIQQVLYTSVPLTHYKTIDQNSIAVLTWALLIIITHALLWGWMETRPSHQLILKKRSQFFILMSTSLCFFIGALLIIESPDKERIHLYGAPVVVKALDNLHNTVFSPQHIESVLKISPSPKEIQNLFSDFLNGDDAQSPLAVFFKNTGLNVHIFSFDKELKTSVLYSPDRTENTNAFIRKIKEKNVLQELVTNPNTPLLEAPLSQTTQDKEWLVFPKSILNRDGTRYMAIYTLAKDALVSPPSPLLKDTIYTSALFILNLLILGMFLSFLYKKKSPNVSEL